jgi:hypothetical protein
MSAVVFYLRKQELKTNSALTNIGNMTGFIMCSAVVYKGIETDDEQLRQLTEHEAGSMDVLINVAGISHIAEEQGKCSIVLNNGNLIFVNDDINSLITKLRQATSLVSYQ